jgi:hypothetical protein
LRWGPGWITYLFYFWKRPAGPVASITWS